MSTIIVGSTASVILNANYQTAGTYVTGVVGTSPISASGTTAITVTIDQAAITGATAATNAQVVRFLVKNTIGTTIPKGSAVYVSGATGDNALISLASATSDPTSSKTLGITAESIANDAFGYVIEAGYLTDIDTSATTAGAAVWLGNTPGSLVFVTPPAEPSHSVYLGVVVRVQSNNGSILVKVQNGYELDELHDVFVGGVSTALPLVYNSTSSGWVAQALTSVGIADNAIVAAKINAGAVGSAALADNAVVAAKINAGSVGTVAISSGSATSGQILQANGSGGVAFTTLASAGAYWLEITGALDGTSLGITDQAYVVQNVDSVTTDITIASTRADFSTNSSRRITSLSNLTKIADNGGVNWTNISTGIATTRNAQVIEYGGSLYIIGASATVLVTSPDGTTWTARTSQLTNGVFDAVYGSSLWVIVGGNGQLSTSILGESWTSRTSGFGTDTIYGVDYSGSIYAAVGDSGKITTSTDGTTWTARTSNFGASNIYDVVYADGKFVAVGGDGKISTSTDGITWTSRTSNAGGSTLNSVTYGNGYFLAIGSGALVRSTDGITWTSIGSQTGYSIAYGNNTFVYGSGVGGILFTSSDNGSTWVTRTASAKVGTTEDILYANNAFWAVGDRGILVKSVVQNKNVLFSPITYSTKP
jgi:photosystem II stability/assembly factor-like uncharacterized protein